MADEREEIVIFEGLLGLTNPYSCLNDCKNNEIINSEIITENT